MPGEFVDSGAEWLDSSVAQDSLAQFIDQVLDRVTAFDDVRVQDIREQWRAIQAADAEEQAFCTLAGRMGIDPYDRNEMTDEFAQFLEQTVTGSEDPLVRDLTEVAKPRSIVQQWSWLLECRYGLGIWSQIRLICRSTSRRENRWLCNSVTGFQDARLPFGPRQVVSLDSPLNSVESVAREVCGRELRIEDRNHVPGHGIRAIVGRSQEKR